MRAMPEKCDLPEKNAFNASILFQKSSECKKCFFNAGIISRCLHQMGENVEGANPVCSNI